MLYACCDVRLSLSASRGCTILSGWWWQLQGAEGRSTKGSRRAGLKLPCTAVDSGLAAVTWCIDCACEYVCCSVLQVVVVYPEDEVDSYIALADAIEDVFPELQVY